MFGLWMADSIVSRRVPRASSPYTSCSVSLETVFSLLTSTVVNFLFPLLRNLKIGLDEQNELYRELTVLQGLSSIITHMRVGMMGGKEVKGGGD